MKITNLTSLGILFIIFKTWKKISFFGAPRGPLTPGARVKLHPWHPILPRLAGAGEKIKNEAPSYNCRGEWVSCVGRCTLITQMENVQLIPLCARKRKPAICRRRPTLVFYCAASRRRQQIIIKAVGCDACSAVRGWCSFAYNCPREHVSLSRRIKCFKSALCCCCTRRERVREVLLAAGVCSLFYALLLFASAWKATRAACGVQFFVIWLSEGGWEKDRRLAAARAEFFWHSQTLCGSSSAKASVLLCASYWCSPDCCLRDFETTWDLMFD